MEHNKFMQDIGQGFLQRAFEIMKTNSLQENKKLQTEQCQIQYLKKYYDCLSSIKKLTKLIEYYASQQKNQRFTHPFIKKLIFQNSADTDQFQNPQKSQSVHNFNFYSENLLDSQILRYKNVSCESISLLETLDSLSPKNKNCLKVQQKQKMLKKQYFAQSLNYVPFKLRKQHKLLNQYNQNIKKTLQTVQRQWQKHSKCHKKEGKSIKIIA